MRLLTKGQMKRAGVITKFKRVIKVGKRPDSKFNPKNK